MSVYDDVRHHHATLDGLWRGKIAKAPASINDPVFVTITSFDKGLRWGPCKWVTKGATLPQRGQDCLVCFDETQRRPTVIAWWVGTEGGNVPE